MWLRAGFLIPLALLVPTALNADGCGGTDPDPDPPADDYEAFQQLIADVEAASSQADKQALTDAFFQDIAYSGGFPIIDGDTATFVYQASGITAPIRVAGDFNNWSASQYTLTQSPGFNLYYTTVTLTDAGARSLYKFIGKSGGQDTYVPDPHARRFQWDTYGEYSLIAGGTNASHLERWPAFWSDELQNERDLYVYLPAGYEEGSADLPVLYMHDGQNLFDPAAFWGGWQADDVADDLIAQGEIEPVILAGMSNTYDRMDEYTHVEDFVASAGGVVGGDGEIYSNFVVDEVKPFIEARYRITTDRARTGVLGSSLGGLISYYIGWRHPEVFGYVGGMSSTFGWGKINLDNQTVIEIMADAGHQDQIMYLDSGGGAVGSCSTDTDGDGIWDDNETAGDNYCETLQMKSVLEAQGWSEGVDLFYTWAPGAEHNEAEWHNRMDEALLAFLGR